MELMIAIAIISILATIAMPSLLVQRQRNEVAEALRMVKGLRDDITGYYRMHHSFPRNNSQAGAPEPHLIIGNKVTRVEIEDGVIHITLGNKVSKPLQDKIVSMRPATVTGSQASPISWLCGLDEPVQGMEAAGIDKTDISAGLMPASCNN